MTKTKKDIIVCDSGAHSIKLGFGGEKEPALIVPCLLGTPVMGGDDSKKYLGDDALEHRKELDLSYLFSFQETKGENGYFGLKDSDELEALVMMALNKLIGNDDNSVDGFGSFSEYKLFLARPANMTHRDLEQLLDLFFHGLKFKAVTMFSEGGLVLRAQNQETGLVVEAGEGSIRISALFDGLPALTGGSRSFPIAGRSLTRQLVQLFVHQGLWNFNPNRDFDLIMANPTKQSFCYAAPCYEDEKRCAKETTLLLEETRLLDGTDVDVEKERFEAVECIFDPTLIGKETKGLPQIIAELVATGVDVNCRRAIFGNVILSGGTGRIPGFQGRLEQELRTYCMNEEILKQERANEIRVVVAKDNAVFCGAASTADLLGDKRDFWVTQSEYRREGAMGFLNKCKM